MATTEARVEANRRNAQRSTGPRTEAGKAASRLNATRHGLAGSDDLVIGAEATARVEARASALIRELGAVGEAGAVLARRAAVLSLRMEAAARRDLVAVARDRAAALAAFDAARAARVEALVARLGADATVAPEALAERHRAALRGLEALPEGIAPLVEFWEGLGKAVGHADPTIAEAAAEVARGWLGLAPAPFAAGPRDGGPSGSPPSWPASASGMPTSNRPAGRSPARGRRRATWPPSTRPPRRASPAATNSPRRTASSGP